VKLRICVATTSLIATVTLSGCASSAVESPRATTSSSAASAGPVVADGKLVAPYSYGDGGYYLEPPTITGPSPVTAEDARQTFAKSGLFPETLAGGPPTVFLAKLTRLGGGTAQSPSATTTTPAVWIVLVADAPVTPAGGGTLPSGSANPSPTVHTESPGAPAGSVSGDVVGVVDAQSGELLGELSATPDESAHLASPSETPAKK
jgi:hypothetical protein